MDKSDLHAKEGRKEWSKRIKINTLNERWRAREQCSLQMMINHMEQNGEEESAHINSLTIERE